MSLSDEIFQKGTHNLKPQFVIKAEKVREAVKELMEAFDIPKDRQTVITEQGVKECHRRIKEVFGEKLT